ncbi:MAG: hypothetical protein H3C29_01345 [Simplicispira suum]|uniref:hypothetical protein n=1 Tax=Simplicispira suum TaxID=2109915 RepID=UPI001C6B6E9E|nr:hypothetical protein [Simplicispira suum]MBW7831838.1 hypothetical protein [Simplicispira suum]
MNRIFQLLLVATVICMSTTAIAQKSTQELLREIESSNRAAQLEMEQSRLRWQQMEAETARRHAEIDRLRAETDRLRMWNESQEAADRAREIAERAEQAAAEQAEAARMAEEAAEELRDEIEQSAVRTKNNIYLGIMLIFVSGFIAYVIRQSKKEPIMQENQKFGIAAIIGAGLVILLAVVISDDWVYRFDFLQNLMSSLRIKLFVNEERWNDITYYIDIPTKYVVLTCICAAAYGLTTYLGITPVPRKRPQSSQNASDEIAH